MNGSGLGRPGAQNEYFLNKALIKNEQIRALTAKSPKSAFSNKALSTNEHIRARAAKNPQIRSFYKKLLIKHGLLIIIFRIRI